MFSSPKVVIEKEEEAYPPASFVAECGGLLGLFVGFNFLLVDGSYFYTICKIVVNLLLCPLVFYGSQENHLGEGNHLAEDKPTVNHLDV